MKGGGGKKNNRTVKEQTEVYSTSLSILESVWKIMQKKAEVTLARERNEKGNKKIFFIDNRYVPY